MYVHGVHFTTLCREHFCSESKNNTKFLSANKQLLHEHNFLARYIRISEILILKFINIYTGLRGAVMNVFEIEYSKRWFSLLVTTFREIWKRTSCNTCLLFNVERVIIFFRFHKATAMFIHVNFVSPFQC